MIAIVVISKEEPFRDVFRRRQQGENKPDGTDHVVFGVGVPRELPL
jgi:hypothetical protein